MTEQEQWRFDLARDWLERHPVPAHNPTDRALWHDSWVVVNKPPSEWPPLEIVENPYA